MTAYRRVIQAGASYFFKFALADRDSDLLTRHIHDLRAAWAQTIRERPFRVEACVVLPDHLHAVWTLPEGDSDYATRWGAIKSRFTRAVKGKTGWNPIPRSPSKVTKGDAGIWQRRFWEHFIRDEDDLKTHIRYCWGNPVKHGLTAHATDWPFSSIHRDIRVGQAEPEWSGVILNGKFGE